MIKIKIEYIDELPHAIRDKRDEEFVNYESQNGVVCNYKKFTFVIRNDEALIVGALDGYTAFAEIYVDDLWVDEDYRRQGYGAHLINELEEHYTNQGYNNINLCANGFAALEFYKKCGFEVEFVRVNEYNPKLTKTFFIKYFSSKEQTQGVLTNKL